MLEALIFFCRSKADIICIKNLPHWGYLFTKEGISMRRFLIPLMLFLLFCPSVHAAAQPELTHTAFLCGYPDGTIRPDAAVTREELACVLFRLIQTPLPAHTPFAFADVSQSRWSYPAIAALAGLELLPLGSGGLFDPRKAVSWRDFTAVLDTLQTSATGQECFPALVYAWSTKPTLAHSEDSAADMAMTRAELARAINSLLGRFPSADDAQLASANRYSDNQDPSRWYYAVLIEASVGHTCTQTAAGERWSAVG